MLLSRSLLALLVLSTAASVAFSRTVPQASELSSAHWIASQRGGGGGGSKFFNVLEFGAIGDGVTDDAAAVAAAFGALAGNGSGTVYFPAGEYLINSTVTIDNADAVGPAAIRGDGPSTVLLWTSDSDLFVFQTTSHSAQVTFLLMSDLLIASTITTKSETSTAVRFTGGVAKSQFSQLTLMGQNGGGPLDTVVFGGGFDFGNITDTVTVRDTVIWGHSGDAVRIGRGSEVRIIGGRFIGFDKTGHSVGVHVTGNNGGVHVTTTDLIGGHIGMLIDDSNGAGSNREIFLTHATLDSNWRGLAVADNAYVSVAGCWTASSDQDNIWVSPDSTSAQLVISGGTIFNAGAEGGDPTKDMCNGITVNAGSFQITGTSIRNNKGRGIWVVDGDRVTDYTVTGCRVFSNGQGMDLAGSGYSVTSNVFNGNAKQSDFGPESGGAVVTNNVNPAA